MATHISDYQYSIYKVDHTFNPTKGILCAIAQPRVYRFKQIWAYCDARDYGTGGTLNAFLRFYQGSLMPSSLQLPAIQTAIMTTGLDFNALLVASMPIAFVASASNTNTLDFGNHDANTFQERKNCFSYSIPLRTGGYNTVPKTLDVEIVCDFITIEIAWAGSQYSPLAMLACIGSNHPAAMYPYYNFSPV